MTVIHDDAGNNITEFPIVDGKRVVPVSIKSDNGISNNQTSGDQKTQIVDSSGNVIDSELHDGKYHLLTDTNDLHTIGTLTRLNSTVNVEVHGTGSAIVLVSGTWVGKIVFEGSIDDTWVNLSMVQPNGGITFNGIQNSNQNGSYRVLIISGYSKIRARMSSYTSGSANVEINASKPVGTSYIWQLVPENLNAQIQQIITADTNNSSTTNLDTPSYTFTGTKTSTLGVAGIQVSLFTDKNCQVNVQQSPDGTNWDLDDTYHYKASENFGITVQAISSYVRIHVFTNNETTTVFRLQTALCPIVEAVPRSLDSNGNFKVAMGTDNYGFGAENSPMGDQRVVEPTRLIGASFEGTTIDPSYWTTAASGTAATIAQANAQLLITSGTANAASVTAYSKRRARYLGGSGMRYRAVIQVSAALANNKRRWGIGYGATMPTITDGAWFQWNGTTFSIVTCKGGAANEVVVSSFNGNLGATYDPSTSVKTYEIYWTNSKVYFVVGDEILHTVSASTATWASTMAFHIFMNSLNAADIAESTTLATRTATIYRLGKLDTQPQSYYQAGTTAGAILKYGAGNIHGLILSGIQNNSVITLYDNTAASGTVIWASGAMTEKIEPFELNFHNIPFFTGLTLVIASANCNVLVAYE